jgi:hypothetical protein
MIMGTEVNENETHSPTTELPSEAAEIAEEEPIEQVMTQETTDSDTAESSEPTIESEDQERFEETAKFEEDVEHRPSDIRRKTTRKATKPDSKLISNLHDKLRRFSDAGKKTDMTIRDVQRKIKDLDKRTNTKHHQIITDLQTQVKELQRKIDRIERSTTSTKSMTSIKKTSSKKNKDKNKKSVKKK